MSKKLRKVLTGIIIMLAFCLTMVPYFVSAESVDTGLIDFEKYTDGVTSVFQDDMFNAGFVPSFFGTIYENANDGRSVIAPHTWSTGTDDSQLFGTSLEITRSSSNGSLRILGNKTINTELSTEFSMKKIDADTQFVYDLRMTGKASGGDDDYLLTFAGNQVTFLDNPVCKYETNVWYDIKIQFDFTSSYGRLYMKKHSGVDWNTYDAFLIRNYDISAGASRVQLGYIGSTDGTAYIDNLRVQTIDNMIPTLKSYSDDFEGILSYDATPSDYSNAWRSENFNNVTIAENKVIDQNDSYGKVMTIQSQMSEGSSTIYPSIGKRPFAYTTVPNVRHDIKFKIGGIKDGAVRQIVLNFSDPAHSNGSIPYCIPMTIQNNTLKFDDNNTYTVAIEDNKLYNCEFIYDAKAQIAILAFTDDSGKQYCYNFNCAFSNWGNGSQWGLFYGLDFQLVTDKSSKMYIDDFDWDIQKSGIFAVENTGVKSGLDSQANMDETVIFDFNQSIKATEAQLEDAQVNITCNGVAMENPDYTLSVDSNKVIIKLNNLLKSNTYNVTLGRIKNLVDESVAVASKSFTTADFEVNVTKPVIGTNGDITTTISAAYAEPHNVSIIAAAYDENGKMVQVIIKKVQVNSRTGESVTFENSFTKPCSYINSFVWSSFDSMIPYSEVGTNK